MSACLPRTSPFFAPQNIDGDKWPNNTPGARPKHTDPSLVGIPKPFMLANKMWAKQTSRNDPNFSQCAQRFSVGSDDQVDICSGFKMSFHWSWIEGYIVDVITWLSPTLPFFSVVQRDILHYSTSHACPSVISDSNKATKATSTGCLKGKWGSRRAISRLQGSARAGFATYHQINFLKHIWDSNWGKNQLVKLHVYLCM